MGLEEGRWSRVICTREAKGCSFRWHYCRAAFYNARGLFFLCHTNKGRAFLGDKNYIPDMHYPN